MVIEYGRLNALEFALGGRAAIEAAFEAGAVLLDHKVIEVPFTFDRIGLDTGIVAYNALPGDILLTGWFSVTTAWDATALGDFGTFGSVPHGFFGGAGGSAPDMSIPNDSTYGNGFRVSSASINPNATGWFTEAIPVLLVVSQDGTLTGGDPGASQGEGSLFLEIATSRRS